MLRLLEDHHISESLLRAVVSTAVDGIIVIDEHAVVRLYNAACERLFGYKAEEVLGQNVKMLMPPSYGEEHDGYIEAYRTSGRARIIGIGREVTGRRKDGSEFPMCLSVGEARHNGERYFVGIVHDITAQKQTEESLRAAKQEAETANSAKSDFVAVMSHEIRSPLHGILATAGLLNCTNLEDKQRRYVNTIEQSGESLLKVVNNVLDLSKIEAGRVEVKESRFEIADLVDSIECLWESRAKEKGLEYFTRIGRGVPPALIGDADRLREILDNLVNNAIKFTEHGYVAVKVDADHVSDRGDGGRVALGFEVKDTGIGIKPGHQNRLFGRFEQVDSSYSREHGGSGLGLAICKEICELLGGEIGVTSEAGQGSRFWFTVCCKVAAHPEAARRPSAPATSRDDEAVAGSGLTVLVAEDSYANQRIIRDILECHGHVVDVVPNGRDAVQSAQQRRYDLILMDVRMPIMDGLEATRQIRECAQEPLAVPIVAMTAHAMSGDRDKCLAAGMDDYISKPFTIAEIQRMIAKYAELAGSAGHRHG